MNKESKKRKEVENTNIKKNKTDMSSTLKIENLDKEQIDSGRTNFVPNLNGWTNILEQKVKVEEIENITKDK